MNELSNEDLSRLLLRPRKASSGAETDPETHVEDAEPFVLGTTPQEWENDGLASVSGSSSPISSAAFAAELKAAIALRAPVSIVLAALEQPEQPHASEVQKLVDAAVIRAMCRPEAIVTRSRGSKFLALVVDESPGAAERYCHLAGLALFEDVIVDFKSKMRLRPTLHFGVAGDSIGQSSLLRLFRAARRSLDGNLERPLDARAA